MNARGLSVSVAIAFLSAAAGYLGGVNTLTSRVAVLEARQLDAAESQKQIYSEVKDLRADVQALTRAVTGRASQQGLQ